MVRYFGSTNPILLRDLARRREDALGADSPLTTMSTCRLPQREQTCRSCQSSTGVSAPYRATISEGSGST